MNQERIFKRALELFAARKFNATKEVCIELLKFGEHAPGYHLLGLVHGELGQLNDSIPLLKKAVSLAPDVAVDRGGRPSSKRN